LLQGEKGIFVQSSLFDHPYEGTEAMRLTLPKKDTFWASVLLVAVGMLVGAVHKFANIQYLNFVAFLLVVVAYALMFLGLTTKPL
jgi:hypothetical protein